jgi:hypothetical protein
LFSSSVVVIRGVTLLVKSKETDGLDTWIDWPEKNSDSFGGGKPVFGGR